MRRIQKSILYNICSLLLALSVFAILHVDADAAYVEDEANGIEYNDEATVSVGYSSRYAQGGNDYSYVWLANDGDRVANVKSSSPNLIAKKTKESYSITTDRQDAYEDWDPEKQEYVTIPAKTTATTRYGSTYIAFFAKKAGSYKVTFDVVKEDGTVRCTKTIKVGTYTSGPVVVKSVKYAGKETNLWYPYTTKTKGKLSVKLNSKYKLVSIELETTNSKGETVYKKVKNNKTIKLATKQKYKYSSDWSEEEYDELFPSTWIKITYQNKKTKEIGTSWASLYTINRK